MKKKRAINNVYRLSHIAMAKKAGLSSDTISRVLAKKNGAKYYSLETEHKVMDTVIETLSASLHEACRRRYECNSIRVVVQMGDSALPSLFVFVQDAENASTLLKSDFPII